MHIAMIGAGYVGLVTGACLAQIGHCVVCHDSDSRKINELNAGRIPIFEPGLTDLVAANINADRLGFTDNLADAVQGASAAFIAVGTPSRPGDGHADLRQVYAAIRALAPLLRSGMVIVTKSTVPVGTGDEIARIISQINPRVAVHIAANPEFLREGAAIHDFMNPDRIVIGVEDEEAARCLDMIYRPIIARGVPLVRSGRRTAEMIKYAANTFLAMKITFINEMADLAERIGADIQDVAHAIGLDARIGQQFLRAGPGIGGSCFPKDTRGLLKTAHDYDVPLRIVESVMLVNDARKRAMARKVSAAFGGDLRGKVIAVLGLTFKPETDDVRESPAIPLVVALQDMGAKVRGYDPVGMDQARLEMPDIEYCADAYSCVHGADAVVIVTEWKEFAELDILRIKACLKQPIMVDLRNMFDPQSMVARGFYYDSVGRPLPAQVQSEALLAYARR